MEKMITKQKLSPSAIDVRLSVWGPKKEGAPDIDYPQNYLVMPEETAYTTKEFVPVYAVCESSESACLFASAPDLLRALEDALPTLQSHMERYPNDKDERRIYDAARAAIAKAKAVNNG